MATRALGLLAGGTLLGALLALIAAPTISTQVDRREAQSAFRSLRTPDGWALKDSPVEHVLADGGVLISAVYDAALDATPSSRFLALETADGWQLVGGTPDGSTVLLRRGDLSLSLTPLPEHGVRLELARYR